MCYKTLLMHLRLQILRHKINSYYKIFGYSYIVFSGIDHRNPHNTAISGIMLLIYDYGMMYRYPVLSHLHKLCS